MKSSEAVYCSLSTSSLCLGLNTDRVGGLGVRCLPRERQAWFVTRATCGRSSEAIYCSLSTSSLCLGLDTDGVGGLGVGRPPQERQMWGRSSFPLRIFSQVEPHLRL